MVIDTSRNGLPAPPDDQWCNADPAGAGPAADHRSAAWSGSPRCSGSRVPGESDGPCGRGEPAAGVFSPAQARALITDAPWLPAAARRAAAGARSAAQLTGAGCAGATSPVRRSFCHFSAAAAERGDHRVHQHQVHDLPVEELLQRQRPSGRSGSRSRRNARIAVTICTAMTASQASTVSYRSRKNSPYTAKMSTTGASSGSSTENRAMNGRPRRPKRPDGPRFDQRPPVPPQRLHGAVAPPVALPPQLRQRARRLGAGDGGLLVHDPPAGAVDAHGEVGVLGEGGPAQPAGGQDRLPAERAEGAGDGGHAVQRVVEPPVEAEPDDVLDVLPPADAAGAGCRP